MANLTMLDVVRMTGGDDVVPLIEESVQVHPELMLGATRTITGTGFNSLVRTALPSVGFRNLNEGVTAVKSTYALRRSECFLVDASSECDKAMVDQTEDGADAIIAMEASAMLESAMRSVASQFYYGTATTVETSIAASPTKGFPGLVETYDSTNMEVDAGGGGTSRSSVWLIKWGPQYVQWLMGRNGEIATSETMEVRLTDGSSNPYDGYRKPLTFYVGLHNANPRNSSVRIKNLTAANPLTDTLMFDALQLFPAGISPDVALMSRRSLYQLRASRTATNPTGLPAPIPGDVAGIPIAVTDAILDTENA